MIPFSPPRVDELTVNAVADALRSGWITTGPRTKAFERALEAYTGAERVICLNSWTNAVELVLRWYGVGPGDEVIVPAYTYCATANIVLHLGATPVLADSDPEGFNITAETVAPLLTERTKVVMPVDIGGLPCEADALLELLETAPFSPTTTEQEALGRPLLIVDAAHSVGAEYRGHKTGAWGDVAGFSFHAVKNLTTAEGGALALNTSDWFDPEQLYRWLNVMSLHGQSKDALAKTTTGAWRYDVVAPGYKCNMTDLQAAIGQVELDRYPETLARRKNICHAYHAFFQAQDWAIPPVLETNEATSSYHLYMLRLEGFTEAERDQVIAGCYERGVSVNVHFQPLPLLTAYKERGYTLEAVPNACNLYRNEISLPVYYDLSDDDVQTVCEAVAASVQAVRG